VTSPLLMVGATIVLAGVAPVSGIVPFKGEYYSTVADRYFYVPMIGVAAIAAWGFARVATRTAVRVAGLVAVGLLVYLNLQEQRAWRNDVTLWRHADEHYPGQWQVYINYGVALAAQNRHLEAIAEFDHAVHANPQFASAYSNRASSRSLIGDLTGALADRTRAVELNPADAKLWYSRAGAYYRLGRLIEARADLDRARQLGFSVPSELSSGLDQEIEALRKSGR
jgi:tetratricopeptide (TPR) repeat protein